MIPAVMISIDLIAISILTFGMYFRRHRRRDLVVAFLGVNVGVLAVATVLGSAEVGVGLGLGLFGVLSIIRLRSSEISQTEVAYYFAALALGLMAGLSTAFSPLVIALMGLIVLVMFVGDNPRLFRKYRHQTIQLDTAFTDETKLRFELERMLGARVHKVTVQHLDLVNDTTLVDVRYQVGDAAATKVESEHEALVGAAR
jgi:Ca2+/Na+ antiporter